MLTPTPFDMTPGAGGMFPPIQNGRFDPMSMNMMMTKMNLHIMQQLMVMNSYM